MDHSVSRLTTLAILAATVTVTAMLWPEGDQAAGDGAIPVVTAPPVATSLDPGLKRAFTAAVSAAHVHGYALRITSGFRTATEQARMLVEAVEEHGSEEVARRWVFPPDRSMHVRGLAVDVGDGPAAGWLERHGAAFGLCRTLGWEWWHFEWRPAWEASETCPAPVDDPADAPTASLRSTDEVRARVRGKRLRSRDDDGLRSRQFPATRRHFQ